MTMRQQMNFGEKIKNMLKEAELYRSQGLLNEALEQYQAVEALIRDNEKVKNRQTLLTKIANRIAALNKEIEQLRNPKKPPDVSEKAQDLMREMFSFEDPETKGSAALGGAISLAEFGQYEKAYGELVQLFDYDKLRLDASKNILKYGLLHRSADNMVSTFQAWANDDRFSAKEIETLRDYFQQMLNEAGENKELQGIEAAEPVEPESELEDDDILDITAIRMELPKGPQAGGNVELDVNFQHGKQINLIISQKEKGIIESVTEGDLISGIAFYSPVAIFSGTVYISSKKAIGAGPKRGDYSINMKVIRIEAG
ncbi:MAG: hypothetical protein ACQERN_00640 [Thermodesulfobacteriota bacterium]